MQGAPGSFATPLGQFSTTATRWYARLALGNCIADAKTYLNLVIPNMIVEPGKS